MMANPKIGNHLIEVPQRKPRRFRPVGECVYCGSRSFSAAEPSRPLAEEHIIPFGLGGDLILPEASCRKCAGVTSAFERAAQKAVFWESRVVFDMPTRRRRDRPATLPVLVIDANGETAVEVPIAEFPLLCSVVRMNPPRVLAPADGGDQLLVVFFPEGRAEYDRKLKKLTERFKARVEVVGSIGTDELILLLAKIAHCLTAAYFDRSRFESFLACGIIAKDAESLRKFVGSAYAKLEPQDSGHYFLPRFVYRGRQKLIVWQIALFGRFGAPTYDVVAARVFGNVPTDLRSLEHIRNEAIPVTFIE